LIWIDMDANSIIKFVLGEWATKLTIWPGSSVSVLNSTLTEGKQEYKKS
jgi:hypothetical protein